MVKNRTILSELVLRFKVETLSVCMYFSSLALEPLSWQYTDVCQTQDLGCVELFS